jgi:hypothetical protein
MISNNGSAMVPTANPGRAAKHRISARIFGRILLVVFATWAIVVIGPDLKRVFVPLGSLGFYADNDGKIYDTSGPFEEAASPAYKKLHYGDSLDLKAMRCHASDLWAAAHAEPAQSGCDDLLAVVAGMGGVQYVRPGRTVHLLLKDRDSSVELTAKEAPQDLKAQFFLALDEAFGFAFILLAAWLVWTRPSLMTWGFFLYGMWFNSGQYFESYVWLQSHHFLLFTQEVLQAISQAVGYAGLLLFALSFPAERIRMQWRRSARWLLASLAIVLTGLQLWSFANAFGFETEGVTRASYFMGYAIDILVWCVVLLRRGELPPQDYQRMRWVVWGCGIGLIAFVSADFNQATSFAPEVLNLNVPEWIINALYCFNVILPWLAFEAVRKPLVITVVRPLIRYAVEGAFICLIGAYAETEFELVKGVLHAEDWMWLIILAAFLGIMRGVDRLLEPLIVRVISPSYHKEKAGIEDAIHQLEHATDDNAVDAILVEVPLNKVRLASSALFRWENGIFCRRAIGKGWDCRAAAQPDPSSDAILRRAMERAHPLRLSAKERARPGFPSGLAAPCAVVPISGHDRHFASALYGPHETGLDLDSEELRLLENLAQHAATAYAHIERRILEERIKVLEQRLSHDRAEPDEHAAPPPS